jgi:predicted transcriptional regulator
MEPTLLIDAIVRQTTVLIAQLATSAGLRAPLAHTANQVFLELTRELKKQGLGSKVIADMFGLALSTYHDKVRRMSESQSYRGRSLWEAVSSYIHERETLLQADVLTRFRNDDEASVRAVLNDLVDSGLVFRSGKGDGTTLRAARPEEVSLAGEQTDDGVASLVWLIVHRQGPATATEIQTMVPVDSARLERILARLVDEGRVRIRERAPETRYAVADCVIAPGDAAGWEAAVFDHYQAMVTALCAKLRRGVQKSGVDETVGGSTYGFTVWPGHPHHDEVLGILSRLRSELSRLRQKVHDYNTNVSGPAEERIGVIAYVGQTLIETEHAEEHR